MNMSDFDFDLPSERIAKEPVEPRDASKLLVVESSSDRFRHLVFRDLPDLLQPGDCLVFNNTLVVPARMRGTPHGASAAVEALLTRRTSPNRFEALVRPGKKFREGCCFRFMDRLDARVTSVLPDGTRELEFSASGSELDRIVDAIGEVPLPPYLRGSTARADQYQTIYARHRGSCAAPTAGLHFTETILERLRKGGIRFAEITLHVGPGTFLPVKSEDPRDHRMHSEEFVLSAQAASEINAARNEGGRIIAVGTTSVRVLETCADDKGELKPQNGETDIFIYPGYRWKIVDGLITNFHLPRSTLILLVASFIGEETTRKIYRTAIENNYRFFSFGDASLLLKIPPREITG